MRRSSLQLTFAMAIFLTLPGCAWFAKMGSDPRGATAGKTFYLGGAGPFGHVGSFDVPEGLRLGGYRGAIEVVPWQSAIGWTIRDQIDRDRNESEARRFAEKIRDYLDLYPDRPVNIIALSAGTGIATWALERLPPQYRVNNVIFFSSSLSRTYDLTPALRRVAGRLYSFYSPEDPILKYAVPIAGSVDREFSGVGGLAGFAPPPTATQRVLELYHQRLRNMPWRRVYSRYGYEGGHADATSVDFVRRVVAQLIAKPPLAFPADTPPDGMQPPAAPLDSPEPTAPSSAPSDEQFSPAP